jgi:hypothetical protein
LHILKADIEQNFPDSNRSAWPRRLSSACQLLNFDDTKQMPAYAQSQGGLSSRKEDPADGLRRGPAAVDQKPVDSSSFKGVKFTVVDDHSRGGRNVLQ